jgi:hypothetical protein
MDIEHREMLAGEACGRAIPSTAEERTAKGGRKPAMAFMTLAMAFASLEATASTMSPETATPGGTVSPWRAASPSPTAFEP